MEVCDVNAHPGRQAEHLEEEYRTAAISVSSLSHDTRGNTRWLRQCSPCLDWRGRDHLRGDATLSGHHSRAGCGLLGLPNCRYDRTQPDSKHKQRHQPTAGGKHAHDCV